jgi:hypothetical protein
MSVLELEKQVQSLPPAEQAGDLTPEQQAELCRRMALAREHPETLEPWEGTIEGLHQELDAYCAQKAAGRPA